MKFSILIPAFKAKFLHECISSILAQSCKEFEIVVLNDCSPESIEDIVSSFADDRIRYYSNEKNVGAYDVVDNWNRLLELSHGEFILCMGDDDMLAPNCLEEYSNIICKYPNLDIYHARSFIINDNSEVFSIQDDRPEYETVYSMMWHDLFMRRVSFIGDFLFRRETLINKGGFYKLPLAWGSDRLSTYIVAKEKGIAHVSKPIFLYRQNSLSITKSTNVKTKMEATLLYESWLAAFLEEPTANEMDEKYRTFMINGVRSKVVHDKIYMIGDDLRGNLCKNIFFWIKKRKHFGLRFKEILFAFALSIALKIRKTV